MATKIISNVVMRTRRDTAANWEAKDPVIDDGVIITVTTNAGVTRHKTGDGTKTYTQLPFDDEPLYNALASKADGSGSVNVTLSASSWSNGVQTVAVTGLTATQNGIVSTSQSITSEQLEAASAAQIYVSAQSAGYLTFTCNGDVPTVDIPVSIILLG